MVPSPPERRTDLPGNRQTPSAAEPERTDATGPPIVDQATAALLALAQRQYGAAYALLGDEFADDRDACVHLARGWQALGRALGAPDRDAPATDWLEERLWPEATAKQKHERRDALLAVFAVAESDAAFDVNTGPPCPPSREMHRLCELLSLHVRRFHNKRRGAHGPAGRWGLFVGGALGATAVVAALVVVLGARSADSPGERPNTAAARRKWAPASVEAMSAPGAWRGRYYRNARLAGDPTVRRRSAAVSFNWGPNAPLPELPADQFSARWDSCLTVAARTAVLFDLSADDGSLLLVDGEPLIDKWDPSAMGPTRRVTVLAPGTHHLRVEYYEDAGDAGVELKAAFRGPPGRLWPPAIPFGIDPCRAAASTEPDGSVRD